MVGFYGGEHPRHNRFKSLDFFCQAMVLDIVNRLYFSSRDNTKAIHQQKTLNRNIAYVIKPIGVIPD